MSAPTVQPIFARNILARTISSFYIRPQPFGIADGDQFDPRSLYQNNEQGIWLDPYDMSTMFQDAVGTTPVTALGQPVGLALDKRLGLALGPELVSNGDFSGGATGWTPGTNVAVTGGTAVFSAALNGANIIQTIGTLDTSKYYSVTYTIVSIASGSVSCALGGTLGTIRTTAGTYSEIVKPAASTAYIRARVDGTSAVVDNISVKEIKGNHAFQATAASRPTLEARVNLLTYTEQFDNAAWTKSAATVSPNFAVAPDGTTTADKIVEDTTTAVHRAYQTPPMAAGQQYVVRCYVKAAGRDWCYLANSSDSFSAYFDLVNCTVGAVIGSGVTASIAPVGSGWFFIQIAFTAPSTAFKTVYCAPATGNGGVTYLGNGSSGICLWGADVRLASEAAYPYQRVNAATDYVDVGAPRYLQHDGIDDGLVTNSINFTGTDKMTVVAGVRKNSDAATGAVVELSTNVSTVNGSFYLVSPNAAGTASYAFAVRGTAVAQAGVVNAAYTAPHTSVLVCEAKIGVPLTQLRVNNGAFTPSGNSLGTGNFGNYPLYIGRRGGTSLPFNGRLYGLIVRGAESTAAQIAQTEQYMNSKTRAY